MALISKITAQSLRAAFVEYDRDVYSEAAYVALINYYEDIDDIELGVIDIRCKWSEIDYQELIEQYTDYVAIKDGTNVYAVNFSDQVFIDKDELIDKVAYSLTVISLDNGLYLVGE